MQGNKQRALAVEALGNNNKVVSIEDFTGADNRIERTETRIVQHNIRRIDAGFNQIAAHGHRLVIALQRVIAAEQQIVHLAAVVGVHRTLNPVTIILVDNPGTVVLGGTEHDADLAVGQVL